MADVARHAGVALKTVSRVVNDEPGVSPAMAASVMAAIEALGFRRNESAANLRRGRTSTIGLVVEDISDPFYAALAQAIEAVALDAGLLMLTGNTHRSVEREKQVVTAFVARRVDGLVVVPTPGLDQAYLARELAAGTHVVFIDRPGSGLDADNIVADNAGGARRAVRHLVAQGHERIGFLGDDRELYTASERLRGYRTAIKASTAVADPALVVMGVHGEDGARVAIDSVCATGATAIITGNNRITSEVLRAYKGVPEMAMVCFDDLELADLLHPPLTVIAQDALGMGRRAGEMLLERLGGHAGPARKEQWPTELVLRGSGER